MEVIKNSFECCELLLTGPMAGGAATRAVEKTEKQSANQTPKALFLSIKREDSW